MTLTEIASEMTKAVQHSKTRTAQWILPRGLRLQLTQMDGRRFLRLSRQNVAPSELEVSICREAFQVPANATREDALCQNGRPYVLVSWPCTSTESV